MYAKTLDTAATMPESFYYRKSLEALVAERSAYFELLIRSPTSSAEPVVSDNNQVPISPHLFHLSVEDLLADAESEWQLAKKCATDWSPWLVDLAVSAPPGVWRDHGDKA